jgi:hypothetical protein
MAVVCGICGKAAKEGSGVVEEIPGYGVLCYDCFNIVQQRLRYPSREEISRAVAMVRKAVKT